jgi:hypothetical protein
MQKIAGTIVNVMNSIAHYSKGVRSMSTSLLKRIQLGLVCLVCLFVMALLSACAGVAGTTGNSTASITGSIQSVSAANHTVTINVNGQTYTIGGLSDQQVQALQSQVGKVYTVQVTQNGSAYTITAGTDPQLDENGTPGVNETPNNNQGNNGQNNGPIEPGSIQFIGKVQNVNNTSLTVIMPDGQALTMTIVNGLTDVSDLKGNQLAVGQLLKVTATANTDGSFNATKLGLTDNGDLQNQNTVQYQGVTTSAVGSDHVIHFNVGNKSFSFPISANADLSDFNNNALAIGANQSVKVKVVFTGTSGSAIKVSNNNS